MKEAKIAKEAPVIDDFGDETKEHPIVLKATRVSK